MQFFPVLILAGFTVDGFSEGFSSTTLSELVSDPGFFEGVSSPEFSDLALGPGFSEGVSSPELSEMESDSGFSEGVSSPELDSVPGFLESVLSPELSELDPDPGFFVVVSLPELVELEAEVAFFVFFPELSDAFPLPAAIWNSKTVQSTMHTLALYILAEDHSSKRRISCPKQWLFWSKGSRATKY